MRKLHLGLFISIIAIPPLWNLAQYWIHNPLYSFGFWVPVLAAYLCWRRHGEVAPVPPERPALAIATLCGYALAVPLLRVVQLANPDWRMLDWLLALGSIASLLAALYLRGGWAFSMGYAFPLSLLLTAVPWPTWADFGFVQFAVPSTAKTAAEALWLFGIAVVDEGRTLHTTVGPVHVSEDCSGIRSLHLALMAALFWAAFFRLNHWRPLVAAASGLALAFGLNLVRVMFLAASAVWGGKLETAKTFHDPAGTVAQALLLALLPVVVWWWRPRDESDTPQRPKAEPSDDGKFIPAHLVIAAVAWLMTSEVLAHGWFWLHERNTTPSITPVTVDRTAPIASAEEKPIPSLVRQHYRYSDALAREWQDEEGCSWSLVWLDFARGAQSACTHNVHRPDWCLPAQDFTLVQQLPDLPVVIAGRTLSFHHHFYARRGQGMHLFFATLQDLPAGGERTLEDWTFRGRLRVAQLGVRSQRSQMIHLASHGSASASAVRQAAAATLGRMIVPVQGS